MEAKNYVYILECGDGTFYTGWTNSIEHRVEAHNSGKGAKYTRGRLPVRLVYTEEHPSPSDAMSREWSIKKLTRTQKLKLINRSIK